VCVCKRVFVLALNVIGLWKLKLSVYSVNVMFCVKSSVLNRTFKCEKRLYEWCRCIARPSGNLTVEYLPAASTYRFCHSDTKLLFPSLKFHV